MRKGRLVFTFYCLVILVGLFIPNTVLWILSFSLLYAIYLLTFRQGSPNFIFWGLVMQWISVSIELIYASLTGLRIENLFRRYKSEYLDLDYISEACIVNMLGVLTFTIGVSFFLKKDFKSNRASLVGSINIKKISLFYIFYLLFTILLSKFLFFIPGLTQLISFFIFIKWGFLYLVFYLCLSSFRTRKFWFYLVFVLELSLGFGSFFASSIAYVIFFLFFARISTTRSVSFRSILASLLVVSFVVNFGILWTSVKSDYRSFLTGGLRSQQVVVDRQASALKLFEMFSKVDANKYQEGADAMIQRMGYFVFISKVISYVPTFQPHENGRILLNSFTFYFKPRFLFPDKQVIDDSAHTGKYLGEEVTGREAGTSISLGYVADAYVDFGIPLMFFSTFFLGWFTGWCYQFAMKRCSSDIWVIVLGALFFFATNINGTNTIKVVGPLLINLVCVSIFLYFVAPRIQKFILEK